MGRLRQAPPYTGVLAWTVFETFEWERGYGRRFGLVRINYETLERSPKQSAYWFQEVMDQNAVTM